MTHHTRKSGFILVTFESEPGKCSSTDVSYLVAIHAPDNRVIIDARPVSRRG
jgi:hypothetical protein